MPDDQIRRSISQLQPGNTLVVQSYPRLPSTSFSRMTEQPCLLSDKSKLKKLTGIHLKYLQKKTDLDETPSLPPYIILIFRFPSATAIISFVP
jgi:hypothetical protein